MPATTRQTKSKATPKRPKPEAVETEPDAMKRFTEAMTKIAPPKRPTKTPNV